MLKTHNGPKRVLRVDMVVDRTGESKSSLYAKMAKNLFPRNFKLGERSVGWLESEVDAYITDRVAESRNLTKEGA